ncbi:MAG: hypothetical protein JAY94_13115 [Candidatus Thiodiazotropha endolucinida]|nr:hypothetical protein [Candidatus Thiodiazotropha taylori]MCW4318452.1 hypothetical protein [Candidatus Thiodiazotropha taylori]
MTFLSLIRISRRWIPLLLAKILLLLPACGGGSSCCYGSPGDDGSSNDNPPLCLHGLNAVYPPGFGWYRIDARGNKEGIEAEFTPPREQLAFPVVVQGEVDFSGVWSEPLVEIVRLLTESETYQEVTDNLPDIEIIKR